MAQSQEELAQAYGEEPVEGKEFTAQISPETVLSNSTRPIQTLPVRNAISDPASETIDIVRDFDWTLSTNKRQLIHQIPYVVLREFKLTASNAVDSAFNACSVIAQGVRDTSSALSNTAAGAVARTTATDLMSWINDKFGTDAKLSELMSSETTRGIIEQAERARLGLEKLFAEQPSVGYSDEFQSIFNNLYSRKSTGVSYRFPHFAENFLSVTNTFSETSDTATGNAAIAIEKVMGESAKAIPSLLTPGVYVQSPKFYNFNNEGPAITVSFTLYNTITEDAYADNSKFIQQFLIKNQPRRFTKVVAEPPCIYEVTIPGKVYYPYCYISQFNVTQVGTKRIIQDNEQTEIIPEGYQIDITIQSLTMDASNFYETQMHRHGITPSRSDDGRFNTQGIASTIRNGIQSAQTATQNFAENTADRVFGAIRPR